MPRAPMWSGMRAPEDSPRKTIGRPRLVATRFMWPILRPLVALEDAPITVKSLATTAHSRPSILPKPATLPSAGDLSRSSGRVAEVPNRPDSMKVPASTSASTRSRALSTPAALRRASFSGAAHGERLGALGLVGIARWRRARCLASLALGLLMTSLGCVRRLLGDDALADERIDVASVRPSTSRSTARVSWPMSRPAWRTAPGVSDRRGTTPAIATLPMLLVGRRRRSSCARGSADR